MTEITLGPKTGDTKIIKLDYSTLNKFYIQGIGRNFIQDLQKHMCCSQTMFKTSKE